MPVELFTILQTNKAGHTNRHQSRRLGRGSDVEGRGSGECRTHDSISHVGRSSDAKTARQVPKTPKKQRRDWQTNRQTDQRTDTVTYWKKVEVCLRPFFVFWRNRVFSFLLRKFQNRSASMTLWMELMIKLVLIILFQLAPTRALSDKYFLSYNFLKITIIRDYLSFFAWFLLWLSEQS